MMDTIYACYLTGALVTASITWGLEIDSEGIWEIFWGAVFWPLVVAAVLFCRVGEHVEAKMNARKE